MRNENFYNISRIAESLNRGVNVVWTWYKAGKLPPPSSFTPSGRPLWDKAVVNDFIEEKKKNPNIQRKPKFSDEEIITHLQMVANKLGEKMSGPEYSQHRPSGSPSLSQVFIQFGSWQKALQSAGIKYKKQQYEDEFLLQNLRKAAGSSKKISVQKYKDSGLSPNYTTYIKRFGTWSKAVKAAGLQIDDKKVCPQCREIFTVTSRNQKYCSEPCRDKAFSARMTEEKKRKKACAECGQKFLPVFPRQKYCKEWCRKKAYLDRRIEKAQEQDKVICPKCGGDWIEPLETHRGKPKYCLHCQQQFKTINDRKKSHSGRSL